VLGKFTTRDPSGYPDGPNNYLYVNNNPINSIDPLGLESMNWNEGWGATAGHFFRGIWDGAVETTLGLGAVSTGHYDRSEFAHDATVGFVKRTYNGAVDRNTNRIVTQMNTGKSCLGAATPATVMEFGSWIGVTQACEGYENVESETGEPVGTWWDRGGKFGQSMSAASSGGMSKVGFNKLNSLSTGTVSADMAAVVKYLRSKKSGTIAVDNVKSQKAVTGGRDGGIAWGKLAEADAELAYQAIRKSTTDIEAIARYNNLKPERLQKIKDYLFNNTGIP
jgi:hypothetical protein